MEGRHYDVPQPVGLKPRKGRGTCALCGQDKPLTKTHVPAQASGNTGEVRRYFPASTGGTASRGRGHVGGFYVFGHCRGCNGLQAKHDPAYVTFSDAIARRLQARPPILLLPPGTNLLPEVHVRPGAVARAVLIGMTALNPNLRITHPELVAALLNDEQEFAVPDDLSLRVAATDSPTARVAGSVAGLLLFHRLRPEGQCLGVMSMASLYFRPVAWHLATKRPYSLLDLQGWCDVSHWTRFPPENEVPIRALLRRLPEVLHPSEDPVAEAAGWCQLLSNEITVFGEADLAGDVA
jgi:hypothetical protein